MCPLLFNHCQFLGIQTIVINNHVFELWCWRRLLRIPWTSRRSNLSILKEISPIYSLEGLTLKLKLQYFGHLMQRTDSLEKTLTLGKTNNSTVIASSHWDMPNYTNYKSHYTQPSPKHGIPIRSLGFIYSFSQCTCILTNQGHIYNKSRNKVTISLRLPGKHS